MEAHQAGAESSQTARILAGLGSRCIVMVGMMGAGKTSVGRRLAHALHLPFVDADAEIEKAANLTIPEIFDQYGEAQFREGERRVMARLSTQGPAVLATGGGAFVCPETRDLCREHGVSVWLKAEVPVLLERVRKKGNRPLLNHPDPEAVLRELLAKREPVYALADIAVSSREGPHHSVVAEILGALHAHLAQRAQA